jgi:hypothetical protein
MTFFSFLSHFCSFHFSLLDRCLYLFICIVVFEFNPLGYALTAPNFLDRIDQFDYPKLVVTSLAARQLIPSVSGTGLLASTLLSTTTSREVVFTKQPNFAETECLISTFRTLGHVVRCACEKRRGEVVRQVVRAKLFDAALHQLRTCAGRKKIVRAIIGFLETYMNASKDGRGFDVASGLYETAFEIFGHYLKIGNNRITDHIMGFFWASAFAMKSSVPIIAENVNLFSQFILTSKSHKTVQNCFGVINNLFATYTLKLDQQQIFGKALVHALKEWSTMELVFQVASQFFQNNCCPEQKAKFVNDGIYFMETVVTLFFDVFIEFNFFVLFL